ncbi:MAG TPA: hypothetical protein VK781_13400 [Solirubrobacteraceae bacterium]|jgi:hypothetical protein|nr:hypothetical protein [Solirubrobacteraceae bacterium]
MRRIVRLCGVLAIVALIAVKLGLGHASATLSTAVPLSPFASNTLQRAAQAPTASDHYEPLLGMPASGITILGASPAAQPGETWAYGQLGHAPTEIDGNSYADQIALLEYTNAAGWQVAPLPPGQGGEPLSSGTGLPRSLGALGGRVTPAGGLVLLTQGGTVIRDPSGSMRVAPAPPSELLAESESLPPQSVSSETPTPYAAIEQSATSTSDGPTTGLLIAPYGDGSGLPKVELGVLFYDGSKWAREPIEGASTSNSGFTPESIACGPATSQATESASESCWMLAAYASEARSAPNRLSLFRRVPAALGTGFAWKQDEPAGDLLEKGSPLGSAAQMLTVTSQGVWVDFQIKHIGSVPVSATELVSAPAPSSTGGGSERLEASSAGTWCYQASPELECSHSLGASLPSAYQSYAWPASTPGEPGTRIIATLATGAMLELSPATGGEFAYTPGSGTVVAGTLGSAFDSPQSGWIVQASTNDGPDAEGVSQLVKVDEAPQGDQLQPMPVPFGRPLLAVAQAPQTTPGDPGAEAIAVGVGGEIGHYVPGIGWRPETLYGASGEQPTLRGVAWPEPGRAYAVGDAGTMLLWRADTGLWELDPAAPYNFVGNLSAVAFSPSDPNLGYAVGKQGVLLRYGKTWTQESLPEDLQNVNFTSVTFAGGEAFASYRTYSTNADGRTSESGGVAVQEGTGWHIDPTAATLLGQLPQPEDSVLSKIAGLPDGGVVAAGPGLVIERDSPGASWHFSAQPLPEAQNVAALAAYRDASGALRAAVSIDLDSAHNPGQVGTNGTAYSEDALPAPEPGRPPSHAGPDPLPDSGYLLIETASGWSDMEHMTIGTPPAVGRAEPHDLQVRPDPILALLIDPSGHSGFAVGGQTDNPGSKPLVEDPFQTAAAMRFGAQEQSSAIDASSPVTATPGLVSFAVGGGAACGSLCADSTNIGLGPDVLLTHALQSAQQISAGSSGNLRGFLYTGERLSTEAAAVSGTPEGAEEFNREMARYAQLLGAAGSLPVHVAASPTDVAAGRGLEPFVAALSGYGPEEGRAYYSFLSTGTSGNVMVIVLDFSSGSLSAEQQAWLEAKLSEARSQLHVPAIVMGNAALNFKLPDMTSEGPVPLEAGDASTVSEILVRDGASAYLFDYPGVNVQTEVRSGDAHIPAFGSGALGYSAPPSTPVGDSLVSSGFLLLEVNAAARNPETGVAPVAARIESNIGQLALNAADGVLLRRSQVALFEALARLPESGRAANGGGGRLLRGPGSYEEIPFNCIGPNCADAVASDYTFSSSKPDIGNFVAHDPTSSNPRQVELGPNRLPVADPRSGLFCAFNSGTTTVSITAGGLTYSEPVTVQGGSVLYPCGTVPLKEPPAAVAPESTLFPSVEPPSLGSSPTSPKIQFAAPPVPTSPVSPTVHAVQVAPLLFFPLQPPLIAVPRVIVPPPPPPAARPAPPSGTAQVYQSSVAPHDEREEEAAHEHVNSFAVYDNNERTDLRPWILLLVMIAAGAGVGIRRGRPGRQTLPAYARGMSNATERQRRRH